MSRQGFNHEQHRMADHIERIMAAHRVPVRLTTVATKGNVTAFRGKTRLMDMLKSCPIEVISEMATAIGATVNARISHGDFEVQVTK